MKSRLELCVGSRIAGLGVFIILGVDFLLQAPGDLVGNMTN